MQRSCLNRSSICSTLRTTSLFLSGDSRWNVVRNFKDLRPQTWKEKEPSSLGWAQEGRAEESRQQRD